MIKTFERAVCESATLRCPALLVLLPEHPCRQCVTQRLGPVQGTPPPQTLSVRSSAETNVSTDARRCVCVRVQVNSALMGERQAFLQATFGLSSLRALSLGSYRYSAQTDA